MLVLSWIFKFVLNCMGWEPMSKEMTDHLKNSRYTVCVFSHTSYWDFYVMAMYFLATPSMIGYSNVLIKPQPFKYAGWILRKLGGIPATKVEAKNGGSVGKVVEELKKKPFGSFLLISPKGTIEKKQWRSGYYHIAKALDAPLMTVGLDFERKSVYLSDRISSSEEEPEVREFLMNALVNVVPLNPEQEVVTVRSHDPKKIGLVKFEENIFLTLSVYSLLMISLLYVSS